MWHVSKAFTFLFSSIPDCKVSARGRDYTGTKSTTISGLECQRWDSQYPHSHQKISSDRYPDANSSMAENFCRNPDGREGGPWCYTTSEEVEWEYCGIPDCPCELLFRFLNLLSMRS